MERQDEVATRGWAWQWVGWASWPITPMVLWAAGLAVAVDVASSWWMSPQWYVGRILLSPSLLFAAALVALIGPTHLGCSRRSMRAWREFLMLGVPIVVLWLLSAPASFAFRDVEGVVLAIAGEELVYRLAAIVILGALFARLAGNDWRDTAHWGSGPTLGAIVGAGVMFSILPGHVEQMTGATNVASFLSLAVLLGYSALRTGTLLPGFLVHVTLDLAALSFFAGELPGALRVLVDAGALVGLVLGCMLAGRRLGLRRRVPAVIDLRVTDRIPAPTAR